MHTKLLLEDQKGKDILGDLDINEKTVLKLMTEGDSICRYVC
jgi:hypothetical protein